MTAIQPGPGFVNLVNNLLHAGADDLPAAIAAHVLTQIEEHGNLPDPYLNHWYDQRDNTAVIALLDRAGQVAEAAETSSDFAAELNKRLPVSSLIIHVWGENK
jgi:hypothetical protein